MIEMMGSSPQGFTQATAQALENLVRAGHEVISFEILQQRAAVKKGKMSDYQVKIKAALAPEKATKDAELSTFCPTCHQPAGEDGHLCFPSNVRDKKCDWCGALIVNQRHMCDEKSKKLSYICNSCGRMAISAEHLCHPQKIEKKGL